MPARLRFRRGSHCRNGFDASATLPLHARPAPPAAAMRRLAALVTLAALVALAPGAADGRDGARAVHAARAPRATAAGRRVVHVVPHSHCDTGYKKTYAGYLATEVSSVLSSVTAALDADRSLRFVWAEASYLTEWLRDIATAREAATFRAHVADGRIELVNGAWSMHDEAVTTFVAQLANLRAGHAALRAALGEDAYRPPRYVRPRLRRFVCVRLRSLLIVCGADPTAAIGSAGRSIRSVRARGARASWPRRAWMPG